MLDDFQAVLCRMQSDYEFYIGCETDLASALAEYDLSFEERSALSDPSQLDMRLREDLRPRNLPTITIKISGSHDWVNRVRTQEPRQEHVDHEVAAISAASSDEERLQAALRLIERIG